jgi:hypothetical protein
MSATRLERIGSRAGVHARRPRAPAASLVRRVRRGGQCGGLAVYDDAASRRSARRAGRGVREISLDAIAGTLEPNRAAAFDAGFRPSGPARARWQRVWRAEHRGAALAPIPVVQVGDAYAVRGGHHRVSVAKARGAVTINAIVNAG